MKKQLTITLSDGDISFNEVINLKNYSTSLNSVDLDGIKLNLLDKIKKQKKINRTFNVGDKVIAWRHSIGKEVEGEVLRKYGHESGILSGSDWFYCDNTRIKKIINESEINQRENQNKDHQAD